MAAQLYERSFAVAPNPHEAQRCFWMWYAWRPHRRQRTWLGVWNLPFDDVPLDMGPPYAGSERSRDAYLTICGWEREGARGREHRDAAGRGSRSPAPSRSQSSSSRRVDPEPRLHREADAVRDDGGDGAQSEHLEARRPPAQPRGDALDGA